MDWPCVRTIRIRLGPELLNVTLAYLESKDAESEEAQEHANSSSPALASHAGSNALFALAAAHSGNQDASNACAAKMPGELSCVSLCLANVFLTGQ